MPSTTTTDISVTTADGIAATRIDPAANTTNTTRCHSPPDDPSPLHPQHLTIARAWRAEAADDHRARWMLDAPDRRRDTAPSWSGSR